MWEQAMMSRSRVSRSWSRLSGSSKGQAPTSPAWIPSPATQLQPTGSSGQTNDSAATDSKLLQDLRHHLSDIEQLCFLNETPLSDARVQKIRKEIEAAMPRVYALADEKNGTPIASEARTVRSLAEVFLRKFPDVNFDAMRSSAAVEKVSATGTSSPILQPVAAEQPLNTNPSSSESNVVVQGMSRNDAHEHFENPNEQGYLHDVKHSTRSVTPAQRMVLEAIHDLLSDETDSIPGSIPSYFTAPAARSPEELQQMQKPARNHVFAPNMR